MPEHTTPKCSYHIDLILAAPLEHPEVFQLRYRVVTQGALWEFELAVMIQSRHIQEHHLTDQELEVMALDKVRQALDRGIERDTQLYIDQIDLEGLDSLRN